MSWTVVWLPAAEQELAAVWMAAADRNAVTAASARLDRRLARRGPRVGESRSGGLRVAFAAPLGILFTVDRPARRVTVAQVWATG